MIEPKRPASSEPVNDWVTAKVRKLLKQAKREHLTRGVHLCVCGECSDNYDWICRDGTVTNSLAVHYVERHRDEVPESEIHKLVKLMGVGVLQFMKQDNQWHNGIMYQHSDDGGFVIAENFEEAGKDNRQMTMEDGGVKYQDVKYNWNSGQPIVDFGDFKMAISALAK